MTMLASTLYLEIRLGVDRYAIDAGDVVEVLPLVRIKELPGAPPGCAGIMTYRGNPIPVIDLGLIALGTPTPPRMMTRIVIAAYESSDAEADSILLGLLVPEVIQASYLDPNRFQIASVANDGAPALGPVMTTADGVLQLVSISALLDDDLRDALRRSEHTV